MYKLLSVHQHILQKIITKTTRYMVYVHTHESKFKHLLSWTFNNIIKDERISKKPKSFQGFLDNIIPAIYKNIYSVVISTIYLQCISTIWSKYRHPCMLLLYPILSLIINHKLWNQGGPIHMWWCHTHQSQNSLCIFADWRPETGNWQDVHVNSNYEVYCRSFSKQ